MVFANNLLKYFVFLPGTWNAFEARNPCWRGLGWQTRADAVFRCPDPRQLIKKVPAQLGQYIIYTLTLSRSGYSEDWELAIIIGNILALIVAMVRQSVYWGHTHAARGAGQQQQEFAGKMCSLHQHQHYIQIFRFSPTALNSFALFFTGQIRCLILPSKSGLNANDRAARPGGDVWQYIDSSYSPFGIDLFVVWELRERWLTALVQMRRWRAEQHRSLLFENNFLWLLKVVLASKCEYEESINIINNWLINIKHRLHVW